jgi:hypothetical protein
MKLPRPTHADVDVLSATCTRRSWGLHKASWKAAYFRYKRVRGNPWRLTATTFNPDIGDDLYKLYDSNKNGKALTALRRMELGCCPVCGGTTTGTLDHYLPRDVYPEFSIFSLNLVPACPHCNSGSKGTTVKGASYGERFLHPYFDDLANGPIWRVAFRAPYAMLTFDAVPEQGLSPAQTKMVKFHLQNVLGSQFETFVRTQWGKMPNVLRIRAGGRLPTDPVACRQSLSWNLRPKSRRLGVIIVGTLAFFEACSRTMRQRPIFSRRLRYPQ